jgi:Arc/MetJ family transcription regulator
MRTTITIDDELIKKARYYTGIKENSVIINEALNRLVMAEAGKRLAMLGGTMPNIKPTPRRRSKEK